MDKFFKENGYLCIKNAFSREELNPIIELTLATHWNPQKRKLKLLKGDSADLPLYPFSSNIIPISNKIENIFKKKVGVYLTPTMFQLRAYFNGSSLEKHYDKKPFYYNCSFHISNVNSKSPWPLHFIGLNGKEFEILQNPGDIVIYDGVKVEHWRDKFDGGIWYQLLLAYDEKKRTKPIIFNKKTLGK